MHNSAPNTVGKEARKKPHSRWYKNEKFLPVHASMKRVPGSSLSGDRFFFNPRFEFTTVRTKITICAEWEWFCVFAREIKKNLSVLHEFMRLKKNLQLIKLSHTYKNFAQTKICIAEYFVFHHHPWGSRERRFLASFSANVFCITCQRHRFSFFLSFRAKYAMVMMILVYIISRLAVWDALKSWKSLEKKTMRSTFSAMSFALPKYDSFFRRIVFCQKKWELDVPLESYCFTASLTEYLHLVWIVE